MTPGRIIHDIHRGVVPKVLRKRAYIMSSFLGPPSLRSNFAVDVKIEDRLGYVTVHWLPGSIAGL